MNASNLFSRPLDLATLRRVSSVTLLITALAWAALVGVMVLMQSQPGAHLPILESLLGATILIATWRYYPHDLHASGQAVVLTFVPFLALLGYLSQESAVHSSHYWILVWTLVSTCVITIAFGLIPAVIISATGCSVLCTVFQASHPGASMPDVVIQFSAVVCVVIAFVVHAVCAEITTANTNIAQIDRLRAEMELGFRAELAKPIEAITNLAQDHSATAKSRSVMTTIGDQLRAVRRLIDHSESTPEQLGAGNELVMLEQMVTTATSQYRRTAHQLGAAFKLEKHPSQKRLLWMPAAELNAALAFMIRDAILSRDLHAMNVQARIDDADPEKPKALLIVEATRSTKPGRSLLGVRGDTQTLAREKLLAQLTQTGGSLKVFGEHAAWQRTEISAPVYHHDLTNKPESAHQQEQAQVFAGLHTLLIEDDELTRLLTARNIERRGAIVHQVETGQEALQLLEATDFDLIVADLHLPDTSGAALIASLRARNATAPIIIVTVANGAADLNELVNAGADLLLGKPLQNEHIQQAVALLRASNRL